MRVFILALLVGAVLGFLSDSVKAAVRSALGERPSLVFAVPCSLAALFGGAAAIAGAASAPLLFLVFAWMLAPTLAIYAMGIGPAKRPGVGDFLALGLLWLPLEFSAGASLVPRAAQAFLHSVAYGAGIVLALVLFAGFRGLAGMKYNPPRGPRDFYIAALGFAGAAPVLAVAGLATGFLQPPHLPAHTGVGWTTARLATIFVATALPEELLFRSLLQNMLTLRFEAGNALAATAVIFGCSHLNNGPQPLPNWRYAIVATIAGFAFGKIFQKSGTVLSSAACHTAVNSVKHFFF